jgi:hypothetical protein
MPNTGCDLCIPYAFDFQRVGGRSFCRHCGREIRTEAEFYVVSRHGASVPRRPNNSFERGVRRDNRGLPYLDSKGRPLRMKEPFDRRDYGESPIVIPSGGN